MSKGGFEQWNATWISKLVWWFEMWSFFAVLNRKIKLPFPVFFWGNYPTLSTFISPVKVIDHAIVKISWFRRLLLCNFTCMSITELWMNDCTVPYSTVQYSCYQLPIQSRSIIFCSNTAFLTFSGVCQFNGHSYGPYSLLHHMTWYFSWRNGEVQRCQNGLRCFRRKAGAGALDRETLLDV